MFSLLRKLVFAYVLVVVAAFFMQRDLMYHPDPSRRFDPAAVGLESFEGVEEKNDEGTIRHWYSPPANRKKLTVVYFQGNAGDLAERAYKYGPWIQKGYGVFLIGYRGYGNPGEPTEDRLYADARQAIYHLLDRSDEPGPLVFYGESLGTGIAVQMALEFPAKGLILEAPYTSYPDVGAVRYPYLPVHLLALDRYSTLAKIGKIKVPLLVLHGRADKTVPFEQGEKVFQAAPEPKESFFVDKAGHGDLYDHGAGEAVNKFLEGLEEE